MGFLPCKIKCPIKGCQKLSICRYNFRYFMQESTVVCVTLDIKQKGQIKSQQRQRLAESRNAAAPVGMAMVRSTSNTHTSEQKKHSSKGGVIEHRHWAVSEAQEGGHIICLIQHGNTYISVCCFKAMTRNLESRVPRGCSQSPTMVTESTGACWGQAHQPRACRGADIRGYLCHSMLWFQNKKMLLVPNPSGNSFPELVQQRRTREKNKNQSSVLKSKKKGQSLSFA